MISHFIVINKCGKRVYKKVDVDYDKQKESVKNHTRKNEETGTLRNEINCCGIVTLKDT